MYSLIFLNAVSKRRYYLEVYRYAGHDTDRNRSPTRSCQMIVFGRLGMSLQEYVDNFTVSLTSKCSTCNVNLL